MDFRDGEEELNYLIAAVELFHQGAYNAMGIITRTNREAKELFERLKERQAEVTLVTPGKRVVPITALLFFRYRCQRAWSLTRC